MHSVEQLTALAARCLALIEVQRERPKLAPLWRGPVIVFVALVALFFAYYAFCYQFAGPAIRCSLYGVCPDIDP